MSRPAEPGRDARGARSDRDSKIGEICEICEGANEIQKWVIARQIFGREVAG